jgi:hypothetical protein
LQIKGSHVIFSQLPVLVHKILLEPQQCPFVYILSMIAFVLQWHSVAATEIICLQCLRYYLVLNRKTLATPRLNQWFSESGLEQHLEHPLGTYEKCKCSDPTSDILKQKLRGGAQKFVSTSPVGNSDKNH